MATLNSSTHPVKAFNCIAVIGPTASGKTKLACRLAYELNGEVISADSRQVYRFLNIGTGKDLEEYTVENREIPYHLIDVAEPSQQFYLHQFIEKLNAAFEEIRSRQKLPIICGGTGLYLDTLRKDFSLTEVVENAALRNELANLSKTELLNRLSSYPGSLIQQVDLSSVKRIIRGIEIAEYYKHIGRLPEKKELPYRPYYIGIASDPNTRKRHIAERLALRLEQGLVEEVAQLLKNGLPENRLELLGLEYKFVLHYLQKKLSKQALFEQLQAAIFQFSRRQMTWFRKMEKEGVKINWTEEPQSAAVISSLKELFNS